MARAIHSLRITDTLTAFARTPFFTYRGGEFLSYGPECFTYSAAFIDGSSHGHGVVNILETKTLNELLICQNRQQIAFDNRLKNMNYKLLIWYSMCLINENLVEQK